MGEQYETLEHLSEKIDELRFVLNSLLDEINHNDHTPNLEVMKLSQVLDDYIVKYMKCKLQ